MSLTGACIFVFVCLWFVFCLFKKKIKTLRFLNMLIVPYRREYVEESSFQAFSTHRGNDLCDTFLSVK